MAGRKVSKPPTGFELPSLDSSEDSAMQYTRALAIAVQSGALDPRIGDTLQKVVATHLRALKQKKDQTNVLDEYRQLRAELERLKREGKAREAADRRHARTGADEGPAVWDEEEPAKH